MERSRRQFSGRGIAESCVGSGEEAINSAMCEERSGSNGVAQRTGGEFSKDLK